MLPSLARRIVWSVYLGGANIELFTNLSSGYLEFEPIFSDMARAREFIEQLPFESMIPCNELLQPEGGYCFGKPGEVYVVYFPNGGSLSINLAGMSEDAKVDWFDPRAGGVMQANRIDGGKTSTFSAPSREDWVLLIRSRDFAN